MEIAEICLENQVIPVLCLPNRPKALLDKSVAQIYNTETKYVLRALKNNLNKFPPDFYFQLTKEEFEIIKKNPFFTTLKHSYKLPYAFTHLGSNMLANILRSDVAIRRSLQIVRTFTNIENGELQKQLKGIYDMVCILADEMHTNRDTIRKISERVLKLEKQFKSFANEKSNLTACFEEKKEAISKEQCAQLKDLVAKMSKSRKKL